MRVIGIVIIYSDNEVIDLVVINYDNERGLDLVIGLVNFVVKVELTGLVCQDKCLMTFEILQCMIIIIALFITIIILK